MEFVIRYACYHMYSYYPRSLSLISSVLSALLRACANLGTFGHGDGRRSSPESECWFTFAGTNVPPEWSGEQQWLQTVSVDTYHAQELPSQNGMPHAHVHASWHEFCVSRAF